MREPRDILRLDLRDELLKLLEGESGESGSGDFLNAERGVLESQLLEAGEPERIDQIADVDIPPPAFVNEPFRHQSKCLLLVCK